MLRIRNKPGIWTFALVISTIAIVMSQILVLISFPPDLHEFTAARAAIITALISIPICLFIGMKIRENTTLSQELVRLVNRDRLTDVATRDFFFQRMDSDPNAYGVSLMIDIDHFKKVNDTHGHLIGDEVIKHIGKILRDATRENDIVCRFGGEEFVVFLHEADGDKGLLVAERIRMSVDQTPASADGEKISVTVSIGGSLKERLEDINVSIKQADEALYRAKAAGRNRTVVDWMPSGMRDLSKAS